MTFRTPAPVILLTASLMLLPPLRAQPARPPTLEDILARLEANLNHYDAAVPSLFCDEHVVSSETQPGQRDQNTTTDSVFRLKRTPRPDRTTTLVESREIQRVDGKAPASQRLDGPTLVGGAFEGGLAVVSLNQTVCMNYDLQRIDSKRLDQPYRVTFRTVLTPHNTAACLLQEKTSGHILIDPASLQITHLELTTPHHTIVQGDAYTSAVAGKRTLTVDYAPILLGGETFWMPSAISQQIITGDGTYHRTVWSFQAAYTNYHRLEVTSRILPNLAAAP